MTIQAVGPRFGIMTKIVANDSGPITDAMDKREKPGSSQLSTTTEADSGQPFAITATGHDITRVLKALELEPGDFARGEGLQRSVIDALTRANHRFTNARERAILALRGALIDAYHTSPEPRLIDLTGGEPFKRKERSIPTVDGALYDDTGAGVLF